MMEVLANNYQWLATIVVTIVGLVITARGVKRSFRNEVSKMKQEVAISKTEELPYKIYCLMSEYYCLLDRENLTDDIDDELDDKEREFTNIVSIALSYGSEDTGNICIYAQHTKNKYIEITKKIYVLALLFSQIKYDLTGIVVSVTDILNTVLRFEEERSKEFDVIVNKLIDTFKLNPKFKVWRYDWEKLIPKKYYPRRKK